MCGKMRMVRFCFISIDFFAALILSESNRIDAERSIGLWALVFNSKWRRQSESFQPKWSRSIQFRKSLIIIYYCCFIRWELWFNITFRSISIISDAIHRRSSDSPMRLLQDSYEIPIDSKIAIGHSVRCAIMDLFLLWIGEPMALFRKLHRWRFVDFSTWLPLKHSISFFFSIFRRVNEMNRCVSDDKWFQWPISARLSFHLSSDSLGRSKDPTSKTH